MARLTTYWLELTDSDGQWIDGIDAVTEEEALRVAYWNWEAVTDVKVIQIGGVH